MPNDEIDSVSIGVLASQITFLREDIAELRTAVSKANDSKVSHREWSQRNEHVNNRLQSLGREIGDLRAELRAKSAPWWSIVAVITAAGSLLWTILKP